MTTLPASVQIVEVLLRDGLQNERTLVTTEQKVAWAATLVAAGARRIEAVSFVHPRLVPAMADAEAVMANVERVAGVRWSGLVLNRRGLERALVAGVDEVNVVVPASDTFSRRNQNMSTEEGVDTALELVEQARASGLFTTVTLATAFGCPFEGEVAPDRVQQLAARLVEARPDEICLADTIGVGVPGQVARLTALVRDVAGPGTALRFHFHDTRNTGIANAWEAARNGAEVLDASVGGFGGCPFAPRATGNIATEDLAFMLERSGVSTNLQIDKLVAVAAGVGEVLGKTPPSSLSRADEFPPRRP
ncbi:hydroxymethylglutaryl-CoA lyase [Dactylosporangium sp. NPDC005555]|uniref:hydroxymethylglutaryl-CoA lyase n=1 Tax=Dactylosporangium sp. NPDC005555 TaxID=3154889 RepID=UPI0033BB0F92